VYGSHVEGAIAEPRNGGWQPRAMDILSLKRAMRVRMPRCELKWEIPDRTSGIFKNVAERDC